MQHNFTTMKKLLFVSILSFVLLATTDPYSIKRISDKDFRYEFYTTNKKVNVKHDKEYFWFKGGLIHKAEGGVAGQVLDGAFKKHYHSNQLAEQGTFKKGLKVGLWKTWFENGTTKSTQEYSSGLKQGKFFSYNVEGKMLEKGYYKSGKKHGFWINFVKQDTTRYKNGVIFIKKPKLTKEEKAALKEQKQKERELEKLKKEKQKEAKAKEKELKKNAKAEPKNKTKKEPFYKRIFKKKEKK